MNLLIFFIISNLAFIWIADAKMCSTNDDCVEDADDDCCIISFEIKSGLCNKLKEEGNTCTTSKGNFNFANCPRAKEMICSTLCDKNLKKASTQVTNLKKTSTQVPVPFPFPIFDERECSTYKACPEDECCVIPSYTCQKLSKEGDSCPDLFEVGIHYRRCPCEKGLKCKCSWGNKLSSYRFVLGLMKLDAGTFLMSLDKPYPYFRHTGKCVTKEYFNTMSS